MFHFVASVFRIRVLLHLFLLMFLPGLASAVVVTNISWDSQPQYNRFIVQFDEMPKFNTVDSLQQSKLFYVDVYGLKQNYKRRLITIKDASQNDDATLKYVDAVGYPEHGVLRMVFYVKEGTSNFKVQQLENPARLVIDTIREGAAQPAATPPAEAAGASGSTSLAVNVAPTATATPAPQNQTPATAAAAPAVPPIPEPRLRPTGARGDSHKIVIIDPGHGGANGGASSKVQMNGRNVNEKELTLQFAYYLKRLIDSSPNMVALVTRADDSNVGLRDRVHFAESNQGDLFISLHLNDGAGNNNARGMEVYYLNEKGTVDGAVRAVEERENKEVGDATKKSGNSVINSILTDLERAKLRDWQYESYVFCKRIEQSMLQMPFFSQNYRGIKNANFVVLKNFSMPAILLEIGFITNSEDLKFLVNPQFQNATATLVFNAINTYFAETDSGFRPQYMKAAVGSR